MTLSLDFLHLLAVLVPLIHFSGLLLALEAVARSRTSQGATAWVVSLLSMPYLSIPLYLIFGRNRFYGYVRARRSHDVRLKNLSAPLELKAREVAAPPVFQALENLAKMPFTQGNSGKLLIDGEATFAAIFDAIEKAEKYVLIQFFIARDDELGRKLSELLKRKASQGVSCFYLFDEVGSHSTKKSYWRDLNENGVQSAPFNTRRGGWRNRFQINFRNHRKIVVVDGFVALVGGHNFGDDYLGKGPMGPWRDTHVEVQGPMVDAIQLSFVEDWHWATDEVLDLKWGVKAEKPGDLTALVLPTGPADDVDICSLMFSQLIQAAKSRIWISTPYFVPDPQIISQLKLAVLRGVDVRILLPEKPDHLLSYWAAFSYIQEVEGLGVKFYRYAPAFPHQKVVLIDEHSALIGTANLDFRSLNLNFEISLLFYGASMGEATAKMLEHDFSQTRFVPLGELQTHKLAFRLAVRVARLFSPIL